MKEKPSKNRSEKKTKKEASPQPPEIALEGSLLRREHPEREQTNRKTTGSRLLVESGGKVLC